MSKRYDKLFQHFRRYLKNLLRNYFVWDLPESIDARALEEMLLFESGFVVGFNWKEASPANPYMRLWSMPYACATASCPTPIASHGR